MSWTSNISGHVETGAEENATAAVLQKAAQYVNASSWSFYGTHNTWVLDSEIPVADSLLESIEAAKPDTAFSGGNKVIDGEDPWTPPSMIITSNVPAKPPYTGKGDVPDGVKLPIETPVPLAGTVPDEVLKGAAEFHQDKIVVNTLPDSPKV
jgi:hypothetical protein